MNDNKVMNRAADNIRILAASMVEKAKSGHPGGALTLLTPCIQSSWYTTQKIPHGRVAIVSSWIPVTWLLCSTASWPLSASSLWRI